MFRKLVMSCVIATAILASSAPMASAAYRYRVGPGGGVYYGRPYVYGPRFYGRPYFNRGYYNGGYGGYGYYAPPYYGTPYTYPVTPYYYGGYGPTYFY